MNLNIVFWSTHYSYEITDYSNCRSPRTFSVTLYFQHIPYTFLRIFLTPLYFGLLFIDIWMGSDWTPYVSHIIYFIPTDRHSYPYSTLVTIAILRILGSVSHHYQLFCLSYLSLLPPCSGKVWGTLGLAQHHPYLLHFSVFRVRLDPFRCRLVFRYQKYSLYMVAQE